MDYTSSYFAIIRQTLFNSRENDLSSDYKQIMQIAAKQSTVALHAGALLNNEQVDPNLRKWLQAQYAYNIQAQMTRGKWMMNIVKILQDNNIPVVLMKGYSLAVLYGNPDLREQGDVDLYVGKERYHEACELLRNAYPNSFWQSEEEGSKHFIFIPKEDMSLIVELHHQTAEFTAEKDTLYWLSLEAEGMTKNLGTIAGTSLRTPEPAFNALYIFVHLWHHFISTGCSWRQLTDWALTLRESKDYIDPQKLRRQLTALHLLKPWQALGYLVCKRLQLPEDTMPLYTDKYRHLAKKLDTLILRDGHGGRKQHYFHLMKRPTNRIMQIIRVLGQIAENFAFLFPLFPSIAIRESIHKLWK